MRCSNGRCFIPWIDNLQFRNTSLVVGVTLVYTDIPIRHHLEAYVLFSFAHVVSNTSATKLSLLKKVVIVPQYRLPSTMYLPLLNVAPASPYKCRLKRSCAVLARDIPLTSIRFIRHFYLRLYTRMLTNRKAWRNAMNIKHNSILPTIPYIAHYNDFVSPFH